MLKIIMLLHYVKNKKKIKLKKHYFKNQNFILFTAAVGQHFESYPQL